MDIGKITDEEEGTGEEGVAEDEYGWWVDCRRGKGGKNASCTEEAWGEWRTKGRKAGAGEGREREGTGRKEARRSQEGGECGWNGGKSKREEERFSPTREGEEEEYGKGGFGGKTGERASDRASERARSARRCTVKGVS